MLNVKHYHPSNHTSSYLRDILNMGTMGFKILHECQNDIWGLVNGDDCRVILTAKELEVLPVPIMYIDIFRIIDIHNMPFEAELDELLREFLGDKRHKNIYSFSTIHKVLRDALVRANFIFDDDTEMYVKVPQNY